VQGHGDGGLAQPGVLDGPLDGVVTRLVDGRQQVLAGGEPAVDGASVDPGLGGDARYKASGIGREYGAVGLAQYVEYKTVTR
jgi:hypothetical protein